MKRRKVAVIGLGIYILFVIWTFLIKFVDVQAIGPLGTHVGFSTINGAFHQLTGYNYGLYKVIDDISIVPFALCGVFAVLGLIQLIKRRHIAKVDTDLLFLAGLYVVTLIYYVAFEFIPINVRPEMPEGVLERSYPSSTTLLTIVVLASAVIQVARRVANDVVKLFLIIVLVGFGGFMVIGRLVCGVHWLTDIIGGALLGISLVCLYYGCVPGFLKHYENKKLVSE